MIKLQKKIKKMKINHAIQLFILFISIQKLDVLAHNINLLSVTACQYHLVIYFMSLLFFLFI